MALSTRDLYLVMRARDEASHVLRGLARNMISTQAAAQIATARSNAAYFAQQAAIARTTGATAAQIAALQGASTAWSQHAAGLQAAATRHQRLASTAALASQGISSLGVGMMAMGGIGAIFLVSAVREAIEYERQVKLTTTQVQQFGVSLEEVGAIGLRVAREVGVSFEQIQPALFDIFSSTDASMKQSEILLKAFAKAAVAGQVDIQAAARATIAIMNAYNIPLEKVNDVLDVQFELVRTGVGTYEEFSKVIGNVIPSATRAGQRIEVVAAMLAFLTRNGLSASMAATSAARSLEALSHPKTISRLEDMGIKVKDAAGNMRSLPDILTDLRTKLMALPPTERVAALVELLKSAGGTIQARRFLEQVLLRPGELEELIDYLNRMEGATGAFEQAYGQMSDSVAAKTEQLRNQWKTLQIGVGEALMPAVSTLLGGLTGLLEKFNALPESTKSTISHFILFGSIAAILGGALMVVAGAAAQVLTAIVAIGAPLGIAAAAFFVLATYLLMFATFVAGVWKESDQLRESFENLKNKIVELKDKFIEVADQIKQKIEETFGEKVREGLRQVGEIWAGVLNIIGSIITGTLIPALEQMQGWWKANEETLRPLLELLGQAIKILMILGGSVIGALVITAVMSLVAALITLGVIVQGTVNVLGLLISWFQTVWGWLKSLVNAVNESASAVDDAGGVWSNTFNMVRNVVLMAINAAIGVFNTFRGVVTSVIAACVGAFNNFMGIIRQAGATLMAMAATARSAVDNVRSAIIGAFSAAGSWLVDAGRNIINGLVSGIEGAIGRVRAVLSQVTAMIPSWKGPKDKDLRLLRPTGNFLMRGLAAGIRDGARMVEAELSGLTGNLSGGVGLDSSLGPRVTQGTNRSYNQNINVYTQEIDPRVHAAQLGWELQAVL